jgi:hypothetical protein
MDSEIMDAVDTEDRRDSLALPVPTSTAGVGAYLGDHRVIPRRILGH